MDEKLFERLKQKLFMVGRTAITDFLDYEYPQYEDKDVTEKRMDEAFAQMPPDEFEKYLAKYDIDKNERELDEETAWMAVPSITAKQVLDVFNKGELCDVPSFADLMDMDEFIEEVDSYCITDGDGSGMLVIDGKVNQCTCVICEWDAVIIGDTLVVPFGILKKLFGDRARIAWYNK